MTAVEWLIEQLEWDDSKIARVIGLKKYNQVVSQAKEMEKQQCYSVEDLNKHVIEFLEWREKYFAMYHGNKNRGLYYANRAYGNPYYNEDRHTALTRKYYNLHELLELFNKFKNK